MATMIEGTTTVASSDQGEGRLPKASPGLGTTLRGAALPGPQWSAGERSEPERNEGPGSADRGGKALPSLPANVPDPEVPDRAQRRRFTAEYKQRVLRLADACGRGEVAALLRREGLYSSHLTGWRQERDSAQVHALAPKKRGPKLIKDPKLVADNVRLQRENRRLEHRLRQAETIIEVQKKVSEILGIPLNSPALDEND